MRRLVRDYNLGVVLFVLFFVSWVGQTLVGWQEFVAEQNEHQQTAQVFGEDDYVWTWARATLENWPSEFLQLLTMVVLTAFLSFRGSAESKDSDDEMKETLARLERRLENLAASGAPGGANGSGGTAGLARSAGVAPSGD